MRVAYVPSIVKRYPPECFHDIAALADLILEDAPAPGLTGEQAFEKAWSSVLEHARIFGPHGDGSEVELNEIGKSKISR